MMKLDKRITVIFLVLLIFSLLLWCTGLGYNLFKILFENSAYVTGFVAIFLGLLCFFRACQLFKSKGFEIVSFLGLEYLSPTGVIVTGTITIYCVFYTSFHVIGWVLLGQLPGNLPLWGIISIMVSMCLWLGWCSYQTWHFLLKDVFYRPVKIKPMAKQTKA